MKQVLIRTCKVVLIIVFVVYIISMLWVLEYIITGNHPFGDALQPKGISETLFSKAMKWLESKEKK